MGYQPDLLSLGDTYSLLLRDMLQRGSMSPLSVWKVKSYRYHKLSWSLESEDSQGLGYHDQLHYPFVFIGNVLHFVSFLRLYLLAPSLILSKSSRGCKWGVWTLSELLQSWQFQLDGKLGIITYSDVPSHKINIWFAWFNYCSCFSCKKIQV